MSSPSLTASDDKTLPSAMTSMGGLGDLGKAEKLVAQQTQDTQKIREDVSRRNMSIEESLKSLQEQKFDAKPPEFKPKEFEGKMPENDPVKSFGSIASVIGIMGSLLTKQPLTSALNASTAAMNAYRKNDVDAYQSAYEAWKTNTDFAFKRANWENEQYKTALEHFDKNQTQSLAQIRALATLNQDEVAMAALNSGNIKNLIDIFNSRQEAMIKGTAAQRMANDYAIKQGLKLEAVKEKEDDLKRPLSAIEKNDIYKLIDSSNNETQAQAGQEKRAGEEYDRKKTLLKDLRETEKYKNADPTEKARMESEIMEAKGETYSSIEKSRQAERLYEAQNTAYKDWVEGPGKDAKPEIKAAMRNAMTRGKATDPLTVDKEMNNLKSMDERWSLYQQFTNSEAGKAATPEERARMLTEITDPKYNIAKLKGGNGVEKLSKEAVDFYAEGFLLNGYVPTIGYGRDGATNKKLIIDRGAEMAIQRGLNPGDLAVFREMTKSEQANSTVLTKNLSALRSFEKTAIKIGDDLLKIASKTELGGSPLWNKYQMYLRGEIEGDSDVKLFQSQIKTFATDVSKIITSPGLGGQLTDSARHEVDAFLGGNITLEALQKIHAQLRKDFTYRDQSLQDELDTTRQLTADPTQAWKGGGRKPAATQDYKSSDDVVSAFKKGEITREKASELLKSMGHE
jgi:hypothetical protein